MTSPFCKVHVSQSNKWKVEDRQVVFPLAGLILQI